MRDADATDVATARWIVRDAFAPYIARMDREPAPMTADYAALVHARMVRVLEQAGALVGVIVSYPADDGVLDVETVAVSPTAQRLGCGRVLMADAETRARAAGLCAIRLYTNETMAESLAFYPRIGFRETHRAVEDGYRRVYFRKDVAAR